MARHWIKLTTYLLSILAFSYCGNGLSIDKGFESKITHTVFLERKTGWSSVNTLKRPITVKYLPKSNQFVFDREWIDTLQNSPLSEDELKLIRKAYGNFHFIGEFYNSALPLHYSHLMYVNSENHDVLQLDKMTVDKNGREKIVGAIVYMHDSINYAKEFEFLSK